MKYIKKALVIFGLVFLAYSACSIWVILTPSDASSLNSRNVFSEYICDINQVSAENIRCNGSVSFASTSLKVEFTVPSIRAFQEIVSQGGFSEIKIEERHTDLFRNNLKKIDYVYRKDGKHGRGEVLLAFDKDHLSACAFFGGG